MKRLIILSLAACITLVVCSCEDQRTDFEKKAERDADARRAINTKPKSQ